MSLQVSIISLSIVRSVVLVVLAYGVFLHKRGFWVMVGIFSIALSILYISLLSDIFLGYNIDIAYAINGWTITLHVLIHMDKLYSNYPHYIVCFIDQTSVDDLLSLWYLSHFAPASVLPHLSYMSVTTSFPDDGHCHTLVWMELPTANNQPTSSWCQHHHREYLSHQVL